jgi:isopenicillin-N epimerase
VAQRSNATLSTVSIEYPHQITADVIASRIREAMPMLETPTIVVLDLITSDTGVLMPVDGIIAELKATHPHLRFIVDGAHAAGMLENPLPHGFDVWVGNFHKWLCAPRPSAGMVCATSDIAALMAPLAPSWGYESGFPISFDWQGTSDYSAYLATPGAIEFQQRWSFAERNGHNTAVVDAGAEMLRLAWGVDQHLPIPIEAAWMRMVRLPVAPALTRRECDVLIQRAGRELNAETTIMSVGKHTYVRLSAHMYNEVDDYQTLVGLPKLV